MLSWFKFRKFSNNLEHEIEFQEWYESFSRVEMSSRFESWKREQGQRNLLAFRILNLRYFQSEQHVAFKSEWTLKLTEAWSRIKSSSSEDYWRASLRKDDDVVDFGWNLWIRAKRPKRPLWLMPKSLQSLLSQPIAQNGRGFKITLESQSCQLIFWCFGPIWHI